MKGWSLQCATVITATVTGITETPISIQSCEMTLITAAMWWNTIQNTFVILLGYTICSVISGFTQI